MSEAVHEVAHHSTHEAAHSGTGSAKLIGLLISVLALCLAVSEMLGKSAQTHATTLNIEASNTWNFFQAKTVRQTMVRTALQQAKATTPTPGTDLEKVLSGWQSNIDRWESEPATNEGRKELLAKATDLEHRRDHYLEKYHAYEVSSLIIQLGIVLASVALLSSIMSFAIGSIVVGAAGVIVLAGTFAEFAPILHLLH